MSTSVSEAKTFQHLLHRLDAKRAGNGWQCRCPAHDDHTPSMSLDEKADGRVVVHCHAGCTQEAVIGRLEEMDLWPVEPPPCTLQAYAKLKQFSVPFLKELGLHDCQYRGAPAVAIPYRNANGKEVALRYRTALYGDRTDRFAWRRGDKPRLYGLDRLDNSFSYVILVEGESDTQTLWFNGFPSLGLPGNSLIEERDAPELVGIKNIVVCVEPGQSGAGILRSLANSSLRDRAYLLTLPKDKDFSALHIRLGGDKKRFEDECCAAVKKAERFADYEARQPKRPLINSVPGELPQAATEAEEAIIAAGAPLYQRGELVMPIELEVEAANNGKTMAASLKPIDNATLRDHLARVVAFQKYDGRTRRWVSIDPPLAVCETIASRLGEWKFPRIAGVIQVPILRRDGSLLSEPGYDVATRLYYMGDRWQPPAGFSLTPSREEAERALILLKDLLSGFPFVSPVDQAVALSLALTPFVRPSMLAPGHGISGPTAGSGKTFLVNTVSTIATGRACPMSAQGSSEEEAEKRLNGTLLMAHPMAAIDNVVKPLQGDLLCQALEQSSLRLRRLGSSDMIDIDNRMMLVFTGNNLTMAGDVTRRVLICRLDPKMERPELRQFEFDPLERVLQDRNRYIAAALTILMAYRAAGMPGRLPHLASYGAWSDTVRSALVWLGEADPIECMEAVHANDPVVAELRQLLFVWDEEIGKRPITVAELIDEAKHKFGLHSVLRPLAPSSGDEIDPTKLGKYLSRHEDRVIEGLYLKRSPKPTRSGVIRWQLHNLHTNPETQDTEGSPAQGCMGMHGLSLSMRENWQEKESCHYSLSSGERPQHPHAPPHEEYKSSQRGYFAPDATGRWRFDRELSAACKSKRAADAEEAERDQQRRADRREREQQREAMRNDD
jgi:putative DNA primase/helicase